MDSDQSKQKRIDELEEEIADLKDRMPIHSVSPAMFQRLEELEDELKRLREDTED